MSDATSVEGTGETVGEAKWAALRELERMLPGLDRESVEFRVVTEGERGLLGVGYEPARVVATARDVSPQPAAAASPAQEAPEDLSPEGKLAEELLERAARAVGATASVSVAEREDAIVATFVGGGLGLLIGRHGQTIDALQYLANAIAHRVVGANRRPVTVDAAGYRARRAATLEALAVRSAERASATGRRVELEPMTAVERKVVHEALKDDPEVETESEGTEPNRFVVVVPRRAVD